MSILTLYKDDYKHIMRMRDDDERMYLIKLKEQITKLKEHNKRIEHWLEKNPAHREWMDMAAHRTLVTGIVETKESIRHNINTDKPSHGFAETSKQYDTRNGLPLQSNIN